MFISIMWCIFFLIKTNCCFSTNLTIHAVIMPVVINDLANDQLHPHNVINHQTNIQSNHGRAIIY